VQAVSVTEHHVDTVLASQKRGGENSQGDAGQNASRWGRSTPAQNVEKTGCCTSPVNVALHLEGAFKKNRHQRPQTRQRGTEPEQISGRYKWEQHARDSKKDTARKFACSDFSHDLGGRGGGRNSKGAHRTQKSETPGIKTNRDKKLSVGWAAG